MCRRPVQAAPSETVCTIKETFALLRVWLDRRLSVAQLRLTRSKGGLVDGLVEEQSEQPVTLFRQQARLPLQLRKPRTRVRLRVLRLRSKHGAKSLDHLRILNLDATEQGEGLAVEFLLPHAVARMAGRIVAAAAVVDVRMFARHRRLGLALSSDNPTRKACSEFSRWRR